MTATSKTRAHLVERAIEAFGGPGRVDLLTEPPRAAAAPVAEAPAPPARGHDVRGAPPPPARAAVGLEALAKAGLVTAAGAARTRLSEEIAVLQHQVLRAVQAAQAAGGRGGRKLLVTSARPGEGKTFIALNVAAGIAAGGDRPVVLVDADGKEGSIGGLLGSGGAPGLGALAADAARHPAPLLVPTAVPRLVFLPHGAARTGAPGGLSAAAMAIAVQRVAAALPDHIVVLDTPPCLSTSEPSALASVADLLLMVVEAESTQRGEVEAALDMVEACPALHLVLNRARPTASNTFGAYGAAANG